MRLGRVVVLTAAGLLVGCTRGSHTMEAVRQGVLDHLAARPDLNLNSIEVEVTSVGFRHQQAQATVSIRPRSGGEAFQMRYTLERKGGRWVVKGKAEASGSPHGGPGLPPGHPQLGASGQAGTSRPTR